MSITSVSLPSFIHPPTHLPTLIQHKAFAHPDSLPPEDAIEVRAKEGRLVSPLLNWSTLEKIYPRYPQIQDIQITERVGRWVGG